MDNSNDKLSIKNLLFSKAIPTHIIPTLINGHKVYACIDCGDKFVFESSYNDHINRKSVKISYMCRHCNLLKTFTNRCNLLSHIRSHAFKTATINVSDLKVELLPLCFYKQKPTETKASASDTKKKSGSETSRKPTPSSAPVLCTECKADITMTGVAYKDRNSHFMQYSSQVYSCPICLFALPTVCAFKAHLKLHLNICPYYCPECGIHLANKNINYPYNHDCEGFKMMRATARIICTVRGCTPFHPNDYKEHMKKYHLKSVYKCPFCVVACFNESTMDKHLKAHNNESAPLIFYQCDICPSRYVQQNTKINDNHMKSHVKSAVFPCWACGSNFLEVSSLVKHFMKNHNKSDVIKDAVNTIMNDMPNTSNVCKNKRLYRVLQKCDQCQRSFSYKCKYAEIAALPSECPYKCTRIESNIVENVSCRNYIVCYLCQEKISNNWTEIKKHYAALHKTHKCLDAEILLTRMDVRKYLPTKKFTAAKEKKTLNKIFKKVRLPKQSKSTSLSTASKSSSKGSKEDEEQINYICNKCGKFYPKKDLLQKHIKSAHEGDRFPLAYQCMECGSSYTVKTSFSKHLLVVHGIADSDEYIRNKNCFNAEVSNRCSTLPATSESLKENQCDICFQEFDDSDDLGKHYRVHGMAFLIQNNEHKDISFKEVQ